MAQTTSKAEKWQESEIGKILYDFPQLFSKLQLKRVAVDDDSVLASRAIEVRHCSHLSFNNIRTR